MTQQNIKQQDHRKNASVLDWFAVTACLLLGGLLLVAWPIAIFGSVFLFDALGERPLPVWLFVLGVWGYPVVYISCLIGAIARLNNQSKADSGRFYLQASFFACLPVLYVCVLIGMAYLGFWMMGW